MPGGRPTDFCDFIADVICQRLCEGESLRQICKESCMPSRGTVFRWLSKHDQFRSQYALARDEQAECYADEITDIADDSTNDWMEKHDKAGDCVGYQLNGDHVQRSKLRIEARKWIACKLKPKKYGDKITQEHTGKDGGAIETVDLTKREKARMIAFALAEGAKEK